MLQNTRKAKVYVYIIHSFITIHSLATFTIIKEINEEINIEINKTRHFKPK
jgi:hypothetical protein